MRVWLYRVNPTHGAAPRRRRPSSRPRDRAAARGGLPPVRLRLPRLRARIAEAAHLAAGDGRGRADASPRCRSGSCTTRRRWSGSCSTCPSTSPRCSATRLLRRRSARRSSRCCGRTRSSASGTRAARPARRPTRWPSCSRRKGSTSGPHLRHRHQRAACCEQAARASSRSSAMQRLHRELHPGRRHARPSREYYRQLRRRAVRPHARRSNVVFAQHNLVSDGRFNEFHVIVCRNVMIYFDRTLQERVHAPLLRQPRHLRRARRSAARSRPRSPRSRTAYEPIDARRARLPEGGLSCTSSSSAPPGAGWSRSPRCCGAAGRARDRRRGRPAPPAPPPAASSARPPAAQPVPVTEVDDKEPIERGARLPRAGRLSPSRRAGPLRPLDRGGRQLQPALDRRPVRVGGRRVPRAHDRDHPDRDRPRRRRGADTDQGAGRGRDRRGPRKRGPGRAAQRRSRRSGRRPPPPGDRAVRPQPRATGGSMSADERPNILLVDDIAQNLLALEAVLEPLGCNLVKATSGEQALQGTPQGRVRARPPGRTDAGAGRFRDRGAHQAARADEERPHHLPHRRQQGLEAHLPRVLGRRGRLHPQAVRPRAAALEGRRLRRPAPRRPSS